MNSRHTDSERAARSALDAARADFAEAMMDARDNPYSVEATQRLRESALNGRRVWKAYRDAATAEMATQIDALIPDAFKGESGDVPQE